MVRGHRPDPILPRPASSPIDAPRSRALAAEQLGRGAADALGGGITAVLPASLPAAAVMDVAPVVAGPVEAGPARRDWPCGGRLRPAQARMASRPFQSNATPWPGRFGATAKPSSITRGSAM